MTPEDAINITVGVFLQDLWSIADRHDHLTREDVLALLLTGAELGGVDITSAYLKYQQQRDNELLLKGVNMPVETKSFEQYEKLLCERDDHITTCQTEIRRLREVVHQTREIIGDSNISHKLYSDLMSKLKSEE